jgi:hypothetical protein
MYTTDIQDGGTVSATDEERLPPGGFSLRGGFPGWFGRTQGARGPVSRNMQTPGSTPLSHRSSPRSGAGSMSPTPDRSTGGTQSKPEIPDEKITTFEVLRYIRSTFDDANILDKIPLEAAGNPGAWHAWRTYRINSGALLQPLRPPQETTSSHEGLSDDDTGSRSSSHSPEGYKKAVEVMASPVTARKPGEWNWDGVWELRAKKGMDASVSDAMLFGKDAGDDLIRFMNLDGEELEALKRDMLRSTENGEQQRRGIV